MQAAFSQPALDRLHQAMQARVERDEMPGMVMLLARGDQVHVDCVGVTEFGGETPMRRDTLFRIASMTKPVVAVATLQLIEDGKLALEDPVERWLPELANRRVLRRIDGPLDDTVPAHRPLTVDDLLTFRMGFGHIVDAPNFNPDYPIWVRGKELQLVLGEPDPRTPHDPDTWIRLFGTLPLMRQPGERWQYNAGSLVLGVLLARVAGQPLGDLFAARIFDPLGMRSTGFWLPAPIPSRLPAYYMTNFETDTLEPLEVSTPDEWTRPPAFPSGAGGLVSTVDDYLAFGRMLLAGGADVLSRRSVELMTTNHLTPEQMAIEDPIRGPAGWGYGVAVVTEPDAEWPVPGRYGWSGGYGTTWFNDPHREIVAMAMTQASPFLWNGGLEEFGKLVSAV